jgi:hypothetical protein
MHSEHDDQEEDIGLDNLAASNGRLLLDSHTENLSNYSLTIGEASSLMHIERCKFASNRKVQRMCKEGRIDCWKLSTTRNGQPVAEWLVNEASLRNHIEKHEIKWDEDVAFSSPATPLAIPRANGDANKATNESGNANENPKEDNEPAFAPNALAMPNRNGNASDDMDGDARSEKHQVNIGDDLAMPIEDGDANAEEFGETRSLASLLIENARLTAELEGKRELETEMRDEKMFLRDELKEARAGRKDVAAIAERMLETLETIATGGKLISGSNTHRRDHQAAVSNSEMTQYRETETPSDDVEVANAEDPISHMPNQPLKNDAAEPENPFYI